MKQRVYPPDLRFFATLARAGSLSAAARELGLSTPAVSKHLAQMEARLELTLVNRSTRRMGLTPEGELYLEAARKILGDIDDLEQALSNSKLSPKGLLRVNATLGFGRTNIAPIVSKFVALYPSVEVQLQLSVNPPVLTDDAFDVCIRFGAPPESRLIAKRILENRRLLCASPSYLREAGIPKTPTDLVRHRCISIRQGEEAYGVWRFESARGNNKRVESIKVRGGLSTNDGEIAVQWALDGHGIVMRAEWAVREHLNAGRLVQVLAQYETPDADIYAVYPQRHQHTVRVAAFVKFLSKSDRDILEV
jgi:LysR family transcriptional regulator, transcriptional activator for dmlA